MKVVGLWLGTLADTSGKGKGHPGDCVCLCARVSVCTSVSYMRTVLSHSGTDSIVCVRVSVCLSVCVCVCVCMGV